MPNGISFNGVAYVSVDDMPPDVRRDYERLLAALGDENRDGVPDLIEGLVQKSGKTPQVFTSSTVMVNGQVVSGEADLPPVLRQRLERLIGQLDTDHNGVTDAAEAQQAADRDRFTAAAPQLYGEPAFQPAPPMAPAASVVSPENGQRRWMWLGLVAGVAAVLVCGGLALVALWVFTH